LHRNHRNQLKLAGDLHKNYFEIVFERLNLNLAY